MEPEGVVDALRRIHDALVPGGRIVDTQPVSARPPVEAAGGPLGTLDMTEWARTIATIDARTDEAIGEGLFALEHERRFVVTDEHADGTEFVTVTRGWQGTRLGDELAGRARRAHGPVRLHQEVRLRLLRAR